MPEVPPQKLCVALFVLQSSPAVSSNALTDTAGVGFGLPQFGTGPTTKSSSFPHQSQRRFFFFLGLICRAFRGLNDSNHRMGGSDSSI